MDVILRRTVTNLGRAGEIVQVKDGYARNFLIPHGLAYQATEANKRRAQSEATRVTELRVAEVAEAEALAGRLAGVQLAFTAKAGEGDKLFGSITSTDIARQLGERGLVVDKRAIELHEPIKMVGDHTISIRLHPDVKAELQVSVSKE
jgi:large subunit ribosomal protein L9